MCDVGNWNFWEFFVEFFGNCQISFSKVNWFLTFSKSANCRAVTPLIHITVTPLFKLKPVYIGIWFNFRFFYCLSVFETMMTFALASLLVFLFWTQEELGPDLTAVFLTKMETLFNWWLKIVVWRMNLMEDIMQ